MRWARRTVNEWRLETTRGAPLDLTIRRGSAAAPFEMLRDGRLLSVHDTLRGAMVHGGRLYMKDAAAQATADKSLGDAG